MVAPQVVRYLSALAVASGIVALANAVSPHTGAIVGAVLIVSILILYPGSVAAITDLSSYVFGLNR